MDRCLCDAETVTKGPVRTERALDHRGWFVIALISSITSSTYAANEFALKDFGVFTIVMMRCIGASAILWIWIVANRIPIPSRPIEVVHLAAVGIATVAAPLGLILWGQQFVASGLTAILNSSIAVFTALIAATALHDERLSLLKLSGIVLGIAGVVIAIGVGNLLLIDATSLGQLSILVGCMSFSASTVYIRAKIRTVAPEVATATYLTVSAALIAPLAIHFDGVTFSPERFTTWSLSPAAWGAVGYLTMATVAANLLIYRFVEAIGAGNITLSNLVNVPIAIALGAVLFGEVLPSNAYLGFAVIAVSLLMIDGRILRRLRTR